MSRANRGTEERQKLARECWDLRELFTLHRSRAGSGRLGEKCESQNADLQSPLGLLRRLV
jgi:hypothetical protein